MLSRGAHNMMTGETKKCKVPDNHKEILQKLDALMEDLDVDAIKELLSSIK